MDKKLPDRITLLLFAFLLSAASLAAARESGAAAAEKSGADSNNDDGELSDEEYSLIMENTNGLTVEGERDSADTITREEMEKKGARDLWEAVEDVPGVIQSGGGRRGDSSFTVRGGGGGCKRFHFHARAVRAAGKCFYDDGVCAFRGEFDFD